MKRLLLSATAVTAVASVFVSSASLAQVEVVESTPRLTPAPAASQPAAQPSSTSQMQAEMFYRLQTLQQEVQQLRGLVEEQAYELKRI